MKDPSWLDEIPEIISFEKTSRTITVAFSSGDFEISAIGESLYEINYPRERTFFTSSVDFKSFAEITVHTMRTF